MENNPTKRGEPERQSGVPKPVPFGTPPQPHKAPGAALVLTEVPEGPSGPQDANGGALPPSQEAHAAPPRPRLHETADLIHGLLAVRHGAEIRQDPRQFREALFRELRRRLPAPTGRPPAKHLDRAAELRQTGLTYHQIAVKMEPAFPTWSLWERETYKDRLRNGLLTRKRRSLRMSSATKTPEIVPPTRD